MPTMHITRIKPLSLGKIVAIISGILSFLFYALWILAIIPLLIENADRMGLIIGVAQTETMVTIATFLLVPLIYGAFGFIAGAIVAIIFNIVSGHIGGLEVEIE